MSDSIWQTTVEISREAFVEAAQLVGVSGYEAEQFFCSVKDDLREAANDRLNIQLEVTFIRTAVTVEAENESRKQRHMQEYRMWLEAHKGIFLGLETIIRRMILEEAEYQSDVFLRRRQTKILQKESHEMQAEPIPA